MPSFIVSLFEESTSISHRILKSQVFLLKGQRTIHKLGQGLVSSPEFNNEEFPHGIAER